MMMASEVPRYIVPQKMATPIRHMTVAISVAYGIRVRHDLQQSPAEWNRYEKCYNILFQKTLNIHYEPKMFSKRYEHLKVYTQSTISSSDVSLEQ